MRRSWASLRPRLEWSEEMDLGDAIDTVRPCWKLIMVGLTYSFQATSGDVGRNGSGVEEARSRDK
jgi:hypothetical protein